MVAAPDAPQPVRRIQRNILALSERRLLTWLCARLPAWVTPDQLTGLALVAALAICAGYALSGWDRNWLWLSVGSYFVHWFGDSLDGSLARFRAIERPRFGYFIDHSCDGLAALLIVGGIGLSPYVRIDVALFAVVAYLLLAVHTFLMAKVTGEFPLSHLGGGPTELRVILIALTLAMYLLGPGVGEEGQFYGFDIFVGGFACVMLAIFLVQTFRHGRILRAADTPATLPPVAQSTPRPDHRTATAASVPL